MNIENGFGNGSTLDIKLCFKAERYSILLPMIEMAECSCW